MPPELPKTLSELDPPDDLACRRLLALLSRGGAADVEAA